MRSFKVYFYFYFLFYFTENMEYRHIDLYITYEIGYSMNIHVSMAHLISSSLPSFLCFRGELIGEFQIWSTDALLVLFNCIHLN